MTTRRELIGRGGAAVAGAVLIRSGLSGSPAAAASAVEVIPRGAWAQRTPGPGVAHSVRRLTIHHTAALITDNRRTPGHLRSVESYHRAQGWPDVAYHFFVGIDGSVYQGRDPATRGDTFTSYDPSGHLLICSAANFDEQGVTPETFESTARVLAWAAARFATDPGAIAGHRTFASTSCPGRSMAARLDDGSLVARVRELMGGGGVELRTLNLDDGKRRVTSIEGGVPAPRPIAVSIEAARDGYRIARDDGQVRSFAVAAQGDASATRLAAPVVSMASTPTGEGYWLAGGDGGVFAYGDAAFHGSAGAIRLNRPIVGMAATPGGLGYWLVASDGGIFAYGDATFHGSAGAIRLNRPVVGMAATPSGRGYWLVASDGGIFAYGDATFHGSTGGIRLNRPVTGMSSTASGQGYWLVADDGGIFAFGDARFLGSTGGVRLNAPIATMDATRSGQGYWLLADDGGVFAFGDAPFLGAATDENATAASACC